MANPQKENGFTSIANELLEMIYRYRFSLREIKILLAVIRFTFGFQRKAANLSLRFLSYSTGIKYRHTQTTVSNLIAKNILTVKREAAGIKSRVIQLNKDYEKWNFSIDQKSITKPDLVLTEKVSVALTKKVSVDTTKKVSKKENLNKTLKKDYSIKNLSSINNELFYKNKFFFVDFDFRNELIKNIPGLTDEVLFNEFYKMEVWLESKGKKKDYKRFIVNWLSKNDYSESKIYSKPEEKINLSFNPIEYYGQNSN